MTEPQFIEGAADIHKPLEAWQVFQIADPMITLDTLETIGVPSLKVDLKGRLAFELNRQILSSTGQKKNRLRKELKKLYRDQTSKEEDKRLLEQLLYKKEKKNYDLKINEVEGLRAKNKLAIENLRNSILELRDEYQVRADAYDNWGKLDDAQKQALLRNDPRIRLSKTTKAPSKPSADPYDQKIQEIRDEINNLSGENVQLKADRNIFRVKDEETKKIKDERLPEVGDKLTEIDQSILNVQNKIEEEEDYEKTRFEQINPAVFEKTLAERVAESNALFQSVFNGGQEPHITLPFERIADYDDVNQLFVERTTGKISNMVLIIYRSQEFFGHWCALTRSNDLNRLTYFNPYGAYIDKAIEHIPPEFRDLSQQNFPYLLKLLHRSPYEIHWNSIQLQKMDGKIATCGHWCGLWMRNNQLGKTLEEFTLPFESIPLDERDELVVKLTKPYLEG